MSQASLDHMLASIPLPTLVIDEHAWIVASNSEARALFGVQIAGRHFATVLRQPPIIAAVEGTLADQQEHVTRHKLGSNAGDTPFDITCRYLEITERDQSGVVVVSFQDRADLEHAGQMRRDFVANVSHELRTPLTALIGFVETLRGAARDDPEARDRFLSIMDQEAGRMNRLVGDLLSLSRVEANERVRPTEKIDLVKLLKSTLGTMTPLAKANSVMLSLSGDDRAVTIPGDNDQLRQVFVNLIENGIKYGGTDQTVTLSITLIDHDGAIRAPAVAVTIADGGPGIDPIHLPRLTQRFYRADNHRSREVGGTGLGLAISKHIVNRHRGRMKIESELGKGASFTVILPR